MTTSHSEVNSGNAYEIAYRELLTLVLNEGAERPSRAGPTIGVFGMHTFSSFQPAQVPLLTGRRVFPKGVLGELAGFLRGYTALRAFEDLGCNYWEGNASKWGPNQGYEKKDWAVGRIYGAQWRDWVRPDGMRVDQLYELINGLKHDPYSRRHVMTTFNPGEFDRMCLPPCHLLVQYYVSNQKELHCVVFMRSCDLVLGFPSDMLLYFMLQQLVAQTVGLKGGHISFTLGDAHIYQSHLEGVAKYLAQPMHEAPTFELDPSATVFNFHPNMVNILDYDHGPTIKFDLNV